MRILPHVHNYDMTFSGYRKHAAGGSEIDSASLDYTFVCSCGDVVHTTQKAIDRTAASRARHGWVLMGYAAAIAAAVALIWEVL